MTDPRLNEIPHQRWNPLLDEWVLVSPHRTKRPWQGQIERPDTPSLPSYDPDCYLCPGNVRANGERNPPYEATFVFPNDFAALLPDSPPLQASEDPLFRIAPARGECRVIVYTPRHNATLATLTDAERRAVVDVWASQTEDLREYAYVQIFENNGAMMGASNPHAHGQLWASDFVPSLVQREIDTQGRYFAAHGSPLLVDVVRRESADGERTVAENDHWWFGVPLWAVWPFETLLLPKRAVATLPELTSDERDALASVLGDGLTRYNALFQVSFPYSMGWHGFDAPGFQLHAHFYPPLLRSATVRKFMVGFEMLAQAQRDLTPESAASRLRSAV